LAPFAEELLGLPPPALTNDASSQPLAIAFAIPVNTKGVGLINVQRDVEVPRSRFDAPLSSRFTQIDCTVFFDHVMVPWSRVFLCGDIARCDALLEETNASVHMMHQAAIKNLAQAEFMLGLAVRIAEVTDTLNSPDVRDRIAEILAGVETMRSSLRTAETDATADQWGIFAPSRAPLEIASNLFLKLHPQMVEVTRVLTSSHPIAMLSERDFADPIAPEIEKDYASIGIDARAMVALYRLADDALGSTFASRQVLSFSDSVMTAAPALDATKLQPHIARIKDFLARKD
jgi:4-hydroxyphenylacetate 3-monooxygenase